MSYEAINFGKKFRLFDEQWQPKVIAQMNDYQFKVAKLQGDFIGTITRRRTRDSSSWGRFEDRFSRWCGPRGGGRNVRRPKGRRTQALCRTRGQTIADRAARRAQYGR